MIETIHQRIEQHRTELTVLQRNHDALVADFNNRVQLNRDRYQQLLGAIAELELLLTTESHGANNGQRHPSARSHDPAG